MKTRSYILMVLLAFIVLSGAAASAATISISPHQVNPGDTISVTVQGLPDESALRMDWEVYIDEPGPTFLWSVEGLSFPINLQNASFRITNQNTQSNTVTLRNDVPYYESRELTLSGTSVNGIWTVYHGNDFINGTWPVIRNEGTVEEGKTSVLSLVEWYGIKRANPAIPEQQDGGPENFIIPLSVSGFEDGRVKFTIQVNGTNVLTDTVTVGSPVSRTGTLYLKSSPSSALVYVDGVYYGLTPRKVTGVSPGLRTVKIAKEGYADYVDQVLVTTSGIKMVMAVLNPASGSIRVTSIPSHADVYLDSQLAGTTPMTIAGVSPGTHTLVLKKEGYQEYTRSITITDGETIRLTNIFLLRSDLASSPRVFYLNASAGGSASRINPGAIMDRVNARFDQFR
ncbi:MAG: PEGA domain-containing protein [Methanolinea sp.]|nr:PEGA domain-containing protein [Methanolinea sp.]